MARNNDSNLSRRGYLTESGVIGLAGFLAGCNLNVSTNDDTPDDTNTEFERVGDDWLTFGEANDFGMRYNRANGEFEIAYDPLSGNSRNNIRVEADTTDDKGDVHIDDSLIVKNEIEVSDGGVRDPSYTFAGENDTGIWRSGVGIFGITTQSKTTVKFDNGATRVAGDITTTQPQQTTVWDSAAGHAPNLPAVTATASGDGSTSTFSLSHPLDDVPRVATVTPTSADAAGQYWVSDKSKAAIDITYASPPPNGTENLSYDVVVSL